MVRPPSWVLICLLAAAALPCVTARAQLLPREERPELPDFESPAPAPRLLPPLAPLEPEGLQGVALLFVREFRLEGNSVFGDEELLALLVDFVGREIASEDLVAIRNRLTRHYVEHGYVNSGAVFPDQDPSDGVVTIRLVEGRLAEVRFEGQRYYRETALRWKLTRGLGTPLDEREIEARLQRLVQDRRIEKVRARLLPGEELGEARLVVELEERSPYRGWLELSNYATVGVGSTRGRVEVAHDNLVGLGDVLRARYDLAEGLNRVKGRYELPFTSFGTSLRVDAEYNESEIVDGPSVISDFDIQGDYQGYEAGLLQSLYETTHWTVDAGLLGAWRRSSDIETGSGDLVTRAEQLTLVRFVVDAVYRGRRNVFAARSLLSQGFDGEGGPSARGEGELGSLRGPGKVSTSWLAQLQWVSRVSPLDIETIARVDLQLSADPLLAIEQLAFGGHETVRGYRENEAIRDQGVIASLEIRVPLFRSVEGELELKLAPFIDVAKGWNHSNSVLGTSDTTLVGAGIGLRLDLSRYVTGQLYWGQNLKSSRGDGDLQDEGVQFRIAVGFF